MLSRETVLAVEDFIAAVESACLYEQAVYDGFRAARRNDIGIINAHTAPAKVARTLIALEARLGANPARGNPT